MKAVISHHRVAQILMTYGARPEHWPAEERQAVQASIELSHELRALLQAESAVDRALSSYQLPSTASLNHLLSRVDSLASPGSCEVNRFERFINSLIPAELSGVWRPCVVALTLFIGGIYWGWEVSSLTDTWADTEHYAFENYLETDS